MNRRHFLGTSLATLFLPRGALALNLDASGNPGALSVDYVFYDERFARAERLIDRSPLSGSAVAVRGDVTSVWNGELKAACRRSPLMLAGITTESFYFCLNIMLRSQAGAHAFARRIDRDLYSWSIRTG